MREVSPLNWAWGIGLLAVSAPIFFLLRDLPRLNLLFFAGALAAGIFLHRRPDFRGLSVKTQLFLIGPFLLWGLLGIRADTLVPDFLGLLLVIAAAKILGPRTVRDTLQIFLLAQLFLVGAAVIRLDLGYAFLFITEAWLSVTGLVLLYAARECDRIPRPLGAKLLALGAFLTLGILWLTVLYFIFLPRPQFTFFSAPLGGARTGLSERVAPGSVSALKEDPSVVFRIRWLSGPRPERPYFRVYVYGNYRSGVWVALRGRARRGRTPEGPRVVFEVLPAVETGGLPVLGYPVAVHTLKGPRARFGPEGTVILEREALEPSLWRVEALRADVFPAELPPETFLTVPEALRPALAPLARGLKRSSLRATVEAVLRFLRENYTYTLNPGTPQGDPLLWFLFRSRRGHCEYFATAMVFILRSLGIPARVVGGYAGGQWNPLGGYYLLRARDAHTWVEVFWPGRGWVAFDPTPSSPAGSVRSSSLNRWRLLWDYVEFRWYYWVVEYDFLKQTRLLRALSRRILEPPRLTLPSLFSVTVDKSALLFPLAVLLVILVVFSITRRRRRPPVERLLARLEEPFGPREPGETLREYFTRVSASSPGLSVLLEKFLELYEREVFGGEDTRLAQEEIFRVLDRVLDKRDVPEVYRH